MSGVVSFFMRARIRVLSNLRLTEALVNFRLMIEMRNFKRRMVIEITNH